MSEAKHTPGPWTVGTPHPNNACAYVSTDNGEDVCVLYGASEPATQNADGVWSEQPARDANARLIAAAPCMFEALRRAREFIANGIALGFIRMPDADTPDPAHETPRLIDMAIAKAEGA